ncbi:MAG: hypothetical protein HN404_13840 [Gemmatimonadetes bacterium]|nr:hypothetical protein [Gemmatimonadota bacterium]
MSEPSPSILLAGVAAVDITGSAEEQLDDPLYAAIEASRANDRLFVKALVMREGATTAVVITIDAVAIAEIGSIGNDYLAQVRGELSKGLGIDPACVLINASHCHGVVCTNVAERTVDAVRQALEAMVPVHVGVGSGHEDGIMENRRLVLKSGRVADVRRAYSLPADDEIESVGPIDPEIGILRLDRVDGTTLAVVHHFACHPIQGVPGGGNTADLAGFSCRTIEQAIELAPGEKAMAFFLQGCCADINPILYRDTANPPDAETLGVRLGLSALQGLAGVECSHDPRLRVIQRTVRLPRADLADRITEMEAEQAQLLQTLRPSSLNLKSYIPLLIKHSLSPAYPSYDAHRYLHEASMGREDLRRLDAGNRGQMEIYRRNIDGMEQLTRLQVNLDLLRMHQARFVEDGTGWIDAELVGLRVGGFVLVSFPGELPVELGLRVKQTSPHPHTFVSGVTNGYLYYTPTAEQLANRGGAQEDSDCLVDAAWEAVFAAQVEALLQEL